MYATVWAHLGPVGHTTTPLNAEAVWGECCEGRLVELSPHSRVIQQTRIDRRTEVDGGEQEAGGGHDGVGLPSVVELEGSLMQATTRMVSGEDGGAADAT
jgi:hypothetical protein